MQYKIGKIDLSQIECRVLNTLAGQWDVVEKFRVGVDLYSELATRFYGFPIDKNKPAERGTGKQLELSCLGPDTLILTDQGAKPITAVTLEDRLWDGQEWVEHQGLVDHGSRVAIRLLDDLWVTPEHRFWCGNSWRIAQALHGPENENTLLQALVTGSASLPSRDTWSRTWGVFVRMLSRVLVEHPNTELTLTTPSRGAPHVATLALKKLVASGQNSIMDTPILSLTTNIEDGFWDELMQLLTGVPTNEIADGKIMEDAALKFSGEKIARRFLHTWLRFQVGTIHYWKSTVRIPTETTNLATSDSFLTSETQQTGEQLQPSKKLCNVYDIACSGLRSRFTVVTSAGCLIAHNCGYGAGGTTIVRTARAGTYGPPVYLTDQQGLQARDLYRGTHKFVTALWDLAGTILWALRDGHDLAWGPPGQSEDCMWVHDHRIFGPGGLWLDFSSLERVRTDDGEEIWRHRVRNGYRKTYGARLIQNVCEFLARQIASQAMVRIVQNLNLRILLTEHDSAYILIPVNPVDPMEVLAKCEAEFNRHVPWLDQCPVVCEAELLDALAK